MSSILKSLKKLENETDRRLSFGEAQGVNSRITLRREITSRRRLWRWFFGVVTAVFLVAGGWYLTRSRPVPMPSALPVPSSPAVVSPQTKREKASPPVAALPRRPPSGLPAAQPPAAQPSAAQPPAVQPPAAAPSPGESQSPGAKSPAELIKQAIASRSKGAVSNRAKAQLPVHTNRADDEALENPEKSDLPPSRQNMDKTSVQDPMAPEMPPSTIPSSSAKRPFPPAKPPAAGAKPPAVGENPPAAAVHPPPAGADKAELPPLPADAGLKLEALAWAVAPESRFAVINSQIVREGDSLGAVRVERIEREQVVLRKEGKLWQLRHRPQR